RGGRARPPSAGIHRGREAGRSQHSSVWTSDGMGWGGDAVPGPGGARLRAAPPLEFTPPPPRGGAPASPPTPRPDGPARAPRTRGPGHWRDEPVLGSPRRAVWQADHLAPRREGHRPRGRTAPAGPRVVQGPELRRLSGELGC